MPAIFLFSHSSHPTSTRLTMLGQRNNHRKGHIGPHERDVSDEAAIVLGGDVALGEDHGRELRPTKNNNNYIPQDPN